MASGVNIAHIVQRLHHVQRLVQAALAKIVLLHHAEQHHVTIVQVVQGHVILIVDNTVNFVHIQQIRLHALTLVLVALAQAAIRLHAVLQHVTLVHLVQ